MIPHYLTTKELADRLNVSESWVLARAAKGEIPSINFGGMRRYPEPEIEAWLNEQKQGLAEVVELRSVTG